jgi:hypothetical protein
MIMETGPASNKILNTKLNLVAISFQPSADCFFILFSISDFYSPVIARSSNDEAIPNPEQIQKSKIKRQNYNSKGKNTKFKF